MKQKIREPKQKRSIQKKEQIIKVGFDLICQVGFHKVNTDLIAAEANVSTGIIYNYFIDKRDIFFQGIKKYGHKIIFPLGYVVQELDLKPNNYQTKMQTVILNCIKIHEQNQRIHEEISMIQHVDDEISDYLCQEDITMANNIVAFLSNQGFKIINPNEKIHLIIGIIDNLCHEAVFHKHPSLDQKLLINEACSLINNLLQKD